VIDQIQASEERLTKLIKAEIQASECRVTKRIDALETGLDGVKADIKKIRTAARDQSKPIRQQLRSNRKSLGQAVKAGDTAKIDTLATEQGTLQGQLVAIRANTRVDVKNVLTPEQQQKWTSFQEKREARWEERRQRRHQRGGAPPAGD